MCMGLLNKYITFTELDENGNKIFCILQRDFPHYLAIINTYPSEGNWNSAIGGYNMWVSFNGTLRGWFLPSYKDGSREIQMVLDDMALWYFENRINKDLQKYKKLKINV